MKPSGPEQPWPWLDEWPVFTTHGEKFGAVTRVPPGASLEPLGVRFAVLPGALAVAVGVAAAAGGLVVCSLANAAGPKSWWWLALAIPALGASLFFFAGVHVRGMELIMRERPRNLLILAAVLGGIALGLGALAGVENWEGSMVLTATVIAAACAATLLVFGVRGTRRARSDRARILRLRATGTAHGGQVISLPEPGSWNCGGDVSIRYADDAGDRFVRIRLNAYAHEIPRRGNRVVVFTDGRGDLLVELDPRYPVEYHRDYRAYETDTSGGGSM